MSTNPPKTPADIARERQRDEFVATMPKTGNAEFDQLMKETANIAFDTGWMKCANVVSAAIRGAII